MRSTLNDEQQRRQSQSQSHVNAVDGMLDPQPSAVARGDLRTLVESLESRIQELEAQLAKKSK